MSKGIVWTRMPCSFGQLSCSIKLPCSVYIIRSAGWSLYTYVDTVCQFSKTLSGELVAKNIQLFKVYLYVMYVCNVCFYWWQYDCMGSTIFVHKPYILLPWHGYVSIMSFCWHALTFPPVFSAPCVVTIRQAQHARINPDMSVQNQCLAQCSIFLHCCV